MQSEVFWVELTEETSTAALNAVVFWIQFDHFFSAQCRSYQRLRQIFRHEWPGQNLMRSTA
jgi:hypothetical protein